MLAVLLAFFLNDRYGVALALISSILQKGAMNQA
jgi:hypothetical protein